PPRCGPASSSRTSRPRATARGSAWRSSRRSSPITAASSACVTTSRAVAASFWNSRCDGRRRSSPPAPGAAPTGRPGGEGMSETMLVVDDEANIRHALRGVLADEGYDVVEAPDGRLALELLERQLPSLAIVDIWMPEVDGIELVSRMRQRAPEVPVIVI